MSLDWQNDIKHAFTDKNSKQKNTHFGLIKVWWAHGSHTYHKAESLFVLGIQQSVCVTF